MWILIVGHHYYGKGVEKVLGPYETINAAELVRSKLLASMNIDVEIYKLTKVGETEDG